MIFKEVKQHSIKKIILDKNGKGRRCREEGGDGSREEHKVENRGTCCCSRAY